MSADIKTLEAKLLALQEELREAKAVAALEETAAAATVVNTHAHTNKNVSEATWEKSGLESITIHRDGTITSTKRSQKRPKASANKDAADSLSGNAPNKAKPAEVRPVREEV